jgi:uncharacterized protein YaiL (DUF2058 family)
MTKKNTTKPKRAYHKRDDVSHTETSHATTLRFTTKQWKMVQLMAKKSECNLSEAIRRAVEFAHKNMD